MSIIKQIKLEDINGSLTELADIGAKAENVILQNGENIESLSKHIQDKIQFEEMPIASITYLDKIIQYVGETTANYTNGYFYKCVSDGAITPTYSWVEIINGGSGSGDMLASVYDPNGTVADADGIVNYINNDYVQLHLIHNISEYISEYGLENVSNIMDCGAVGDGIADDSSALKDALKIVNGTTNIKVVYLPKGKYNLNGANHTAITWPANVIIAGESADFVEVLNSNIEAPGGIECRDITFNGGTTKHLPGEGGEGGINPSLQDNNVILYVTPKDYGAYVIYTRCKFKNADIASLAFWYDNESHPEARPLYTTIIDNCEFFKLNHCGVYHSCNIYEAKITNSYFHDMGNVTLEEGSFACIRLGDTSNNTPSDVDNCIISNNKFDTFMTAYDYSLEYTQKALAANMIMIHAWKTVITNNKFKDLLGFGSDRETIYTKAVYAEIAYNFIENGCPGGEGAIACKPRGFDDFPDRNINIHNNTIIGPWGSGIAVYGTASIRDNKIEIEHISRGIRAYGNITDANNSMGTVDIAYNNIDCGIGDVVINGRTIPYPALKAAREGVDPPGPQPIISALSYSYQTRMNNNIITIRRDENKTACPAPISAISIRGDIDIKNNSMETYYNQTSTGSNITVGLNGASTPLTYRKDIHINIENNSGSDCTNPINVNLFIESTHANYQTFANLNKIISIINNSMKSIIRPHASVIGLPNNTNTTVIYHNIYDKISTSPTNNGQSLLIKDIKYVYVEDTKVIRVGTGNTVTYEARLLDFAPVISLPKVSTLPTASEHEFGKLYFYDGETDVAATLAKGAIYECISDGASTPSYSWKFVSIPVEILQAILQASNTFDDFKSYVLQI